MSKVRIVTGKAKPLKKKKALGMGAAKRGGDYLGV